MNLYEKLLKIQKAVPVVKKDGTNQSDRYKYASGEEVLNTIRPAMDELGLLLIPRVDGATLHEGTTRSGTTRFMTEMFFTFTWHDVESGEELSVPFYAQGADLGGERGVGKAATYGEKYFLLKFFHVATSDDPDADNRTKTGEQRTKGTAAERENLEYMREAVPAMLAEMCDNDAEKMGAALVHYTKSSKRNYPGVSDIKSVTDAALPVVYGKVSTEYEKRTGHKWGAEG